MTVSYECHAGAAVVTFDNPPLNIFGQAMRAGLQQAIARARDDNPERLILTGAGGTFVAGSDAREFDGPPLDPQLNEVLAELVALPFPTVAAMSGPALGGGLEIALACRYRIAAPGATLGQLEVTLGLVPGAGATQRLPRLTGLGPALDLIAQGQSVTAVEALSLGLVDALAADPLAEALALSAQVLRLAVGADHRPAPAADPAAVAAAHTQANRRSPGQDAPHLAIDLTAAAATEPLDQALIRERAAFIGRRHSPQARALRHVFFAERAAQSQGRAYPAPAQPLQNVIVVGGGLMGAGIAYAMVVAGLGVHVVETDAAGVARAEANLDRLIGQGVARGAVADEAALRARLRCAVGYDALPAVDLAIEAAFESIEVKRTIFGALARALPRSTILATNTSYLDVNLLAQDIPEPTRFLGLHFFAPAHVMKLLEIVRGDQTSDRALGLGFALARMLGKIPVVSGVCDGFIGNRILARYRQAADVLLIEGALPADVDAAVRGFGMAMGPYEAQDMSGLDIAHANRKRQGLRDHKDIRYVPIADTLVEDLGRLGRKSGAGWYDYDAAGKQVVSDAVTQVIVQAAAAAGIARVTRSPDQIAARAVLAMIQEAIRILDEGIAARPADIDLVLVHGYGFPRWRGGLMHHADTIGAPVLLAQLETLAAEDPLSWSVPALLRKLVREGRDFHSLNG